MDRAGRFWRQGALFEHPRIIAFLRRHIERKNDAYIIQIEEQWVPLEVEDLPLRVRALRPAPQANLCLVDLDDGRRTLPCDLQSFRCDAQERVSCKLPSASKRSEIEARLTNPALLDLSAHLEGLEEGPLAWVQGDSRIALPRFYQAQRA